MPQRASSSSGREEAGRLLDGLACGHALPRRRGARRAAVPPVLKAAARSSAPWSRLARRNVLAVATVVRGRRTCI